MPEAVEQGPPQDPYRDLPRLGSYGGSPVQDAGAAPEEITYTVVDYFGEPVRVMDDPLSLTLTLEEFMDVAATLEGDTDVRAIGHVRGFLRAMIAPEDWPKFWRLVRQHRQGVEEQMGFGKWLIEEITGHPTALQSASSDGLQGTDGNSEGDASSRVQARLEQQGRPDLAAVVVLRREQHEAQ
jgi:hypothetical protein